MVLMDGIIFLASIAVILLGAAIFTNGVEWLGKRLNVSEGVVGSIFAAVGTALPETMIPVIAILFGADLSHHEVGVGAILGAPLMLSCLTIPLLCIALLCLAGWGKRDRRFYLNYDIVATDLEFFLGAYALVFLLALIPTTQPVRWAAAIFLVFLYGLYVKRMFAREAPAETQLEKLYFSRSRTHPSLPVISLQVLTGLGCIIGGAYLFVEKIHEMAPLLGISPLILALFIAPIATELPEKFNSLIWISKKKDTLAVGNITGAMVFQGTLPVAIGLVGTEWHLSFHALLSVVMTIFSATLLLLAIRIGGRWNPRALAGIALLYLCYGGIVYFF